MTKNLLYIGLLYNYGKQEEGYSYEKMNLQAGMEEYCEKNNINLLTFHPDVDSGNNLCKFINNVDIVFDVPFDDNLCPDLNLLQSVKRIGVKVLNFCPDVSWRFNNFLVPRKDIYSHFITTHPGTVGWFKQHGMKVIMSQWGGSPLYKNKQPKKFVYDVSFIGQKHGNRAQIIHALNQAGIKVHLFGQYWDDHPDNHGFISYDEVIEVFNSTKINLNLSNPFQMGTMPQIKGRHFEIPKTQGFQLTTPADGIKDYFIPGREIVIADCIEDLAFKIRFYLDHEEERETIAKAGYDRVQKEHLWSHRFDKIFKEIYND